MSGRVPFWGLIAFAIVLMAVAPVSAQPVCAGICPVPNSCPVGGYAALACPVITDNVIRDTIASRLAGSVATREYPICVDVQNGVVTLTGAVADLGTRDLAVIFASSVRGVVAIRNYVQLSAGGTRDLMLVRDVRNALAKSTFDYQRVRVEVNDGVVRLRGAVRSEFARDQAALIAGSVLGVKTVYNNIAVMQEGNNEF